MELRRRPKLTIDQEASMMQQLTDAELAEPRDWRKVIELRYLLGIKAIDNQ